MIVAGVDVFAYQSATASSQVGRVRGRMRRACNPQGRQASLFPVEVRCYISCVNALVAVFVTIIKSGREWLVARKPAPLPDQIGASSRPADQPCAAGIF